MNARRWLALALVLACSAPLSGAIQAQESGTKVHALTLGDAPKYGPDFKHLDYVNPDAAQQTRGRSILAVRDAVVIVPRDPLPAGTYDVSIAVKGTTYQWSFTIDPASQPNTHRVLPDWVSGALPPTVGSP